MTARFFPGTVGKAYQTVQQETCPMTMPAALKGRLRLPVIAAPMFLVSGPELVIACCNAGVIGTFPSLNARPIEQLDGWLQDMEKRRNPDAAPFGVNLIVHRSNSRLAEDTALVVAHQVPIVITSVGHPGDIVAQVHAYGGLVFHDVINMRHAQKAIEAGVDGIIAVCAGAGGHAGQLSPFAFIPKLREQFDGAIILAGSMSDGKGVRAAEILGADFAYLGTRFIATRESMADQAYKEMIVQSDISDIVYTDQVSGIMGNFLAPSLVAAGVDPTPGAVAKSVDMDLSMRETGEKKKGKAWKSIWSAGQGVGGISDCPSVQELVDRLAADYENA
jgi:nitronate monooxygenase